MPCDALLNGSWTCSPVMHESISISEAVTRRYCIKQCLREMLTYDHIPVGINISSLWKLSRCRYQRFVCTFAWFFSQTHATLRNTITPTSGISVTKWRALPDGSLAFCLNTQTFKGSSSIFYLVYTQTCAQICAAETLKVIGGWHL